MNAFSFPLEHVFSSEGGDQQALLLIPCTCQHNRVAVENYITQLEYCPIWCLRRSGMFWCYVRGDIIWWTALGFEFDPLWKKSYDKNEYFSKPLVSASVCFPFLCFFSMCFCLFTSRPSPLPSLRRLVDTEDELSDIQSESVPSEVRDWLASTFTRQMGLMLRRNEEKPRFRSIVHAVQAGIFVER